MEQGGLPSGSHWAAVRVLERSWLVGRCSPCRAMAAHALGAANASPLHIVRGHKCDLPAARSPSQPAGRAAELDAELLKEVEMDDAVAKSQ